MGRFTKQELERFNKTCKQKGDCSLWQNYLDRDGYGTFYFRKKPRRAHRVAYYFFHGDIPKGMVIDHICKNRNCVAITHLRMVTRRQNTLDNSLSVGAINSKKTCCKNGHPFDKKYGNARYCSICESAKKKRLRKKWKEEADKVCC